MPGPLVAAPLGRLLLRAGNHRKLMLAGVLGLLALAHAGFHAAVSGLVSGLVMGSTRD